MTGYTLGLDIGMTSVGFAGLTAEEGTLLVYGAHVFDAAENPKDGSSLAAPRRQKRGLRRVTYRRRQRKRALRRLLAEEGFQDLAQIDSPPEVETGHGGKDHRSWPWDLRREGLERRLTDGEFARVLFHITKRRGFQSNRKAAEPNDTEGQKVLEGIRKLEEEFIRSGCPTIGSCLATLEKKRNGDGCYERTVKRDWLRDEVDSLFRAQARLGQTKATDALKEKFRELAFFQRPLRGIADMVGFCPFEPSDKRAAKNSFSAEQFLLWSKLNNLLLVDEKRNETPLTLEQKQRIARRVFDLGGGMTFKQIRAELKLPETLRFNLARYSIAGKAAKTKAAALYQKRKEESLDDAALRQGLDALAREEGEKKIFFAMTGTKDMQAALGLESREEVAAQARLLDDIATLLTMEKDDRKTGAQLQAWGLSPAQVEAAQRLDFSKVIGLGLTALRNIQPHLERGLRYDEACREAGYDHSRKAGQALGFLPPFADVRNPVVGRALAQTRKVVNAIIRVHGMPDRINVELAREMAKPWDERRALEKEQKENEARREQEKEEFRTTFGREPKGDDTLKLRLWKEQKTACAYCGVIIAPEELRDPLALQVDHILPYSRSWDNGFGNKALCCLSCNQTKGNRTPFEAWGQDETRWGGIRAVAAKLPRAKRERLLMEAFDSREQGWKERHLTDTRYVTRIVAEALQLNLYGDRKERRVVAVNGGLTALLRRRWGLEKSRDTDRHHALDAIVIACATPSIVKRVADWNRTEAKKRGEEPHCPKPWPGFREDVLAALGKVFVSRLPSRKGTGAAHEDTIRSLRTGPDGERRIVQKIRLANLKPETLDNMVDRETRNKDLYEHLKARLEKHGNDPKKAFAEPVHMPPRKKGGDGKPGPLVHSVRVVTNEKSGIVLPGRGGGIASNGDMVRVDVFARAAEKGKKKGRDEYYLCPIYVSDLAKRRLTCKLCVSGKEEADWIEADAHFRFLFSLSKNDYVVLEKEDGERVEGYFAGMNRHTASISLQVHDKDREIGKRGIFEGLGVKSLRAFKKYNVDYFGNRYLVGKERRHGVAKRSDSKPGEAQASA